MVPGAVADLTMMEYEHVATHTSSIFVARDVTYVVFHISLIMAAKDMMNVGI